MGINWLENHVRQLPLLLHRKTDKRIILPLLRHHLLVEQIHRQRRSQKDNAPEMQVWVIPLRLRQQMGNDDRPRAVPDEVNGCLWVRLLIRL